MTCPGKVGKLNEMDQYRAIAAALASTPMDMVLQILAFRPKQDE
jgi:hypothetical protein